MGSKVSRLTYLFEVCQNGTCTVAEKEEYLQMVLDPAMQAQLRVLLEDAVNNSASDREMDETQSNAILKGILSANARLNDEELPLPSAQTRVVRIFYRVAAAMVLLAAGIGVWRWLRPIKPSDDQVVEVQKPVLPGKEGALLTLADGRVVVLDSLGNGLIDKQGNSKVSLKNRQLVYDANPVTNADEQPLYNTMHTPRGRQFHVRLPDGTIVWMNAASEIRYPTAFNGKERTIEVNGEVYLQVAKDPSKPFIVKKKEVAVNVLGTEFNVNAYDDEPGMKVTLVEGVVNVVKGSSSGLLRPGQQALIGDGVQIKDKVDIAAVTAWKNGMFIMRGIGLAALMRQISRWYDVEVITTGTLPDKQFGGIIGMDLPLSDVVKALQSYGLNVKLENRKLTIQP
ncbi:MAG: FecR domain-containing protein [Chitinophagaceae bacterium]|nr:FecR domain-containing protein [Chitinophagaceae bacterium]